MEKTNSKKTHEAVHKSIGFVPGFLGVVSEAGAHGAWRTAEGLFFDPHTALSPKLKNLVSFAVSSQIPCEYTSAFLREMLGGSGVDAQEMKEAVNMAALTRLFSTFLHGTQVEEEQFICEADQVFRYVEREMRSGARPSEMPINSVDDVYKDIDRTLGSVPSFLGKFPREAIAGAWLEMKQVELNPNTALSPKYKELIGLAVAAQIPCPYCVYFHTEGAYLFGATEREVAEAIAVSGLCRHWSALLNGAEIDLATLKKDARQIRESYEKRKKAA